MKNIRNDYCIRMFVGHDKFRPSFSKVNLKHGYLYATNAHIIAKIKSDLCVNEYKEVENYPSADKIYEDHKSVESTKVSVDYLFNELMKIECCFKSKTEECEECDGTGETICHCCNNECECENCNGYGSIETDEIILTSDNKFKLFKKKYKPELFELIIKTAVFTGSKEIEILNDEGTKGTKFIVGDFEIILMPIYERE